MIFIYNAQILCGKTFRAGSVLFGERIERIWFGEGACVAPPCAEQIDACGAYLIPGLIDVHTHGAVGEDFSDGNGAGLEKLSAYYAQKGVTGFLATTMTLPKEKLLRAMEAVKTFEGGGAKCLGVHLEGPFLSYEKRGAQAAEYLQKPDLALFEALNEACGGKVKLVTVAPETEGAIGLIKQISRVCAVSLGHTAADYDTAMRAFEAGASRATHLFNAMQPFLHRAPGVLGAAMDSGAYAEIICDGLHLHPSAVRAAFRLFGKKVNLISDSMRSAGLADGTYELGGQSVFVEEGKATLKDGTLAGSSVHLMDAVKNAVRFGIGLGDAVYAASTSPCISLKIPKRGRIAEGYFADLVLLDHDLGVSAVYICGKRFERGRV